MVGLEAEVEAAGDPLRGEAVVDLAIPHGYAWAFPRGSTYNIGVGTFSSFHARDLKKMLREFGETLALPLAGSSPVGHRVPCAPPRGLVHSGNALVVGDAAGVADPLFAEGISYSLLSGRLAAQFAAKYLRGDRPDLSAYTAAIRSTLAADMRLLRLTASVVHRFPEACVRFLAASPWLQSLLERTIAGEVTLSQSSVISHQSPVAGA
jgi:flavin-dependent dehydrogenase